MLKHLKHALRRILDDRQARGLVRQLSPVDASLVELIRAQNLTYLSAGKLAHLCLTCRRIEERNLPGAFIEAGCALGGSTIMIAAAKSAGRAFFVYDVFGLIPAPTEEDTPEVHLRYQSIVEGKSNGIGGDPYYGYQPDLYAVVRRNLARFGLDCEQHAITMIKGLVQDTMRIDQPVACAHIDVDWYEPVANCLGRIFPHLVVGGCMVLDDYYAWGGCKKAVDEFIAKQQRIIRLDSRVGALTITRTAVA